MPVIEGVDVYADVAYAEAYLGGFHPDLFAVFNAASNEAKDGALVAGTAYLDGSFQWRGTITDGTSQTLGWPRYGALDHEDRYLDEDHPLCDSGGRPKAIKNACSILAAMHLTSSLVQEITPGGEVKRNKVGPIEQEFFEGGTTENTYPFLRRMLTGLFVGSRRGTRYLIR